MLRRGLAVKAEGSMEPLELSELAYDKLEEELLSSAAGRAFLRLRDKRTRLVAQDEWRGLLAQMRQAAQRMGDGGQGATADPAQSPALRIMREELKQLSSYIEQTRQEIAQLRPTDPGANRIMAATNELDAIVSATERATSDILNATERIQELVGRLEPSDVTSDIEAQTIEIMTACSFQDITGQRTTKVVNTLRYIEQRVNTMIEIWGVDDKVDAADGLFTARPDDDRPDAHLLHGPSLDHVSQDNIDALFESLGTMDGAAEAPVPARLAAAEADPPARPAKAAKPAKPPPPPAPAASGNATQADIDALFG